MHTQPRASEALLKNESTSNRCLSSLRWAGQFALAVQACSTDSACGWNLASSPASLNCARWPGHYTGTSASCLAGYGICIDLHSKYMLYYLLYDAILNYTLLFAVGTGRLCAVEVAAWRLASVPSSETCLLATPTLQAWTWRVATISVMCRLHLNARCGTGSRGHTSNSTPQAQKNSC